MKHPHPTRLVARRLPLSLAITAALATAFAPCAKAATFVWDGATGTSNWGGLSLIVGGISPIYLTNWSATGSAPPVLAGNALVFAGTRVLDNTNNYVDLSISNLSFAAGAGAFTLGGNTLTLRNAAGSAITNDSSNRQTINLGITLAGTSVWQGGSAGLTVNGLVTVADANLRLAGGVTIDNQLNGLIVGNDGAGSLSIEGGSVVRNSNVWLGMNSGGNGTVIVTGANSQWNTTGNLTIGQVGTGSLSILDSGNVTASKLTIGNKGSVTLDGGTLQVASGSISSGGIFDWIKGTLRFTGDTSIGTGLLASTTTVGSGKTLKVNGGLTIDNGTLNIEKGGVVSNTDGSVGDSRGSNGTVTVTGRGSQWNSTGDLYIGWEGTGVLNIENGGVVSNDVGWVGDYTGSNGTVKVTGANSQWKNASDLYIGRSGPSSLSILDSGTVTAKVLGIGAKGTVTLDGGTLQIGGYGISSGGVFNWIKGTLGFTGDISIGNSLLGSTTTVGSGKTLKVDGNLTKDKGTLNIEDGGLVSDTYGYLGSVLGSNGTVTVTGIGAQWNNSSELLVGKYGAGTLNIGNGGVVSNTLAALGARSGGSGIANVSGAGAMWNSTSDLGVGASGTGVLNIENGGVVGNKSGYVGANAGGNGTVKVTGANSQWNNASNLYIGYDGTGSVTIENGGLVSNTWGYVGTNAGGSGTVKVTGANSQWNNASSLTIGKGGTGILSILDSGKVTASVLTIGTKGTVNLDGGTLQIASGTISSGGIFNWIKGTLGFTGDASASIGNGLLAKATTVGSGKTLKVHGNLDNDNGSLNIEDGGVVSNAYGYVGVNAGSNGAVKVTGANSQWNTASKLYIGQLGTGSLSILESGTVTAPELAIGVKGTVNLDGGNLQIASGSISPGGIFNWIKGTLGFTGDANIGANLLASTTTVGSGKTLKVNGNLTNDNGNLKITNGGVASSATGAIGDAAGSNGTVTVTGATSAWRMTEDLNVGYRGTGSLDVLAGGEVSSSYGFIGREGPIGSVATVSGAGSKWVNSLELYVTNGSLVIRDGGFASSRNAIVGGYPGSNGSVTVTGAGSQWNNSAGLYLGKTGTGTLNILDAGRVSAQALTIGSAGTLYLGQGAQLGTVSGTVNNNTVSFDGDSSIEGRFTNNGSVVGSAGTLSFLGDVSGAGRYAGDIRFNAHYSPGNSPAAVDFGGGDVTFGSDSVLDIEVFGATPGTQYDQLLHINTLTFNGTLNLIFSDGYVPAPGSLLTLFDFASFSGSLSADHITVTGYDSSKLDFSRLGVDGSLSVTAVPEPAHWALLLAGLVGLGWQSRRQRAGQASA